MPEDSKMEMDFGKSPELLFDELSDEEKARYINRAKNIEYSSNSVSRVSVRLYTIDLLTEKLHKANERARNAVADRAMVEGLNKEMARRLEESEFKLAKSEQGLKYTKEALEYTERRQLKWSTRAVELEKKLSDSLKRVDDVRGELANAKGLAESWWKACEQSRAEEKRLSNLYDEVSRVNDNWKAHDESQSKQLRELWARFNICASAKDVAERRAQQTEKTAEANLKLWQGWLKEKDDLIVAERNKADQYKSELESIRNLQNAAREASRNLATAIDLAGQPESDDLPF
jgi:hypothetical protein